MALQIVPITVDERGLLTDVMPREVDALYSIRADQFPVGGLLPAERRLHFLELVQRYKWLIIEDERDGELVVDIAPPQLLAILDPSSEAHLGSLGKNFSPLLTCGRMLAPDAASEQVLDCRQRTSPRLSPRPVDCRGTSGVRRPRSAPAPPAA